MSGGITGKAFQLASLFGDKTTYKIEYYQREYAWSADDVRTLLSDLFEEFDAADAGRRSRRDAAPQFFLGPFVYAEVDGGRRFLVDGQQRFTTLHLIFMHLLRLMPDDASRSTRRRLDDAVVVSYLGPRPVFRLDIEERQKTLEALMEGRDVEVPRAASLSVQTLCARSAEIGEQLAGYVDSDNHKRVVEWLLDSVVMVGIQAVDKDNGYRIFESMNDRGARLTSVDLIKSYLLSRAKQDEEELNVKWRAMVAEVTRERGNSDAPREFLKAFLIARHAKLDSDAQEIDHAPHEWTRRHADRIGLRDGDSETFLHFVTELIELGRHYATLAAATARPREDEKLSALFYNRINGVTAQMALILAAVQPHDTLRVMKDKARVAAGFVDLLYVLRAIHDDSTRPEDLNQVVLSLVPLVRDCVSALDLGVVLGRELPAVDLDAIMTMGLRGDNRGPVRYLLSRLTAYVEQEMGSANEIDKYLSAGAWHIEHIFADHPDRHPELTSLEFRLMRGRLGGLGLLRASDNTSVGDLAFTAKTQWYSRQNTLLACLAPGYEKRYPGLRKLRTSHHLDGLLRGFGPATPLRDVVETRAKLYRALAGHIWDPARLGLVVPAPDAPTDDCELDTPTPVPPAVRSRGRRTDLAVLVTTGRIRPGTRLHGDHKGTRHEVRIDSDGLMWLSDTDAFRLPDEAGKIVTNRKTCQGWRFWHIGLADGNDVALGTFRDDPAMVAS